MKGLFFLNFLVLCPCFAGAQSFTVSRMYPLNPATYAGDTGRYMEAQVQWILPVAGMQNVYAEAGRAWKHGRWVARIQHFGDALYREGSLGAVWANREGRVDIGAGVDYVEHRSRLGPDRRFLKVDLGMWAEVLPRLKLGLHASGPASAYLHMGAEIRTTKDVKVSMHGIWQEKWLVRGGLLCRIRPQIWLYSFLAPQTVSLGLALKSEVYGMSYSIEIRPYAAYGHHLGIRYEKHP